MSDWMTAQELQDELTKKHFRFMWRVKQVNYDSFEAIARFDAPDGTVSSTMDFPVEMARELFDADWISQTLSQNLAWELLHEPKHDDFDGTLFLYRTVGSKMWLDGLSTAQRERLKVDILPVLVEWMDRFG